MLRTGVLILLFSTMLSGQSEYFTPYPMEAPQLVKTDTLGVRDETVNDPQEQIRIYRKGMEIWLVMEMDQGMTQAWKLNESGRILEVQHYDFNGGKDELILTWQSLNGHSGLRGGVSEQYRELVIYDLENSRILIHLDLMTYVETWWMNYLEDPDSSNLGEISPTYSGQETYCEEYLANVQDSLIKISPVYDQKCSGIEPEEEGETSTFVWRKDAFYRKSE